MTAKQLIKNDWWNELEEQFSENYYVSLREKLKREYESGTVYPDPHDLFNALHLTPYSEVRAVILGQDPYHGPGQAHGLSFSVKEGVRKPPSLKNIYKELSSDLGCPEPSHGSLVKWAEQGVLLLNTVLSVRKGEANSHKDLGWERFTDEVIRSLNNKEDPVVFILWGKHAQAKKELVDLTKHAVIESPHPSPFSANRGFFGSKPFSRTNEFLKEKGLKEIDWCI
ncbi:uracil-DNA glycosylase [Bacillus sp. FJAT-42376]|uniref:uracil-DNA glycosylase n=1 Tax=Bacillus sp. FJAT-42376 TaxID=2014076 RepID=UPI000F4D43CF|nr:uracil-DNA glycosylase [Bacillus sp. FJAT-42376]AZB40963.1 uracil-DNA glycosylase [Bacillus sp. FJAT-42376]